LGGKKKAQREGRGGRTRFTLRGGLAKPILHMVVKNKESRVFDDASFPESLGGSTTDGKGETHWGILGFRVTGQC